MLVFQKAKHSFKKRPQLFLVVFMAGELYHRQYPSHAGQDLRRCWVSRDIHVALHRLCQLRVHFVRNRHDIR